MTRVYLDRELTEAAVPELDAQSYVAAIDIGETKIAGGLVDASGRIHRNREADARIRRCRRGDRRSARDARRVKYGIGLGNGPVTRHM
jgi:hypothetical protein